MKQQYTKGPWSVEFEDKWPWGISITPDIIEMRRIAYCTSNKNLEDVRGATAFDYDKRENIAKMVAEQEANARLIAAAPELLEALDGARDSLSFAIEEMTVREIVPFGDIELMKNRLHKARAAIAKAKGEPQ